MMTGDLPALIVWLTAATLIIGLLVAVVKYVILPIVRIAEALETVESHTKQLTTNGGGHLADVVRDTKDKVDRFDAKWDERQSALDEALEAQQTKVAAELTVHRGETAAEFGKVWRELATRQIYKAADEFLAEADRAERGEN